MWSIFILGSVSSASQPELARLVMSFLVMRGIYRFIRSHVESQAQSENEAVERLSRAVAVREGMSGC